MNTSAFRPTHSVPHGGLDARSQPDPNGQPVARLDQWLDVEVLRTWGAWAEISCSNGWSAWVDARALVAEPPPAPPVESAPPSAESAAPVESAPPVETPQVIPETMQVPTVALPTTPPPTPPPAHGHAVSAAPATRSLPLPAIVGGAVAAVGGFVPWIATGGFSQNAFDIPAKFLVDYKTTGNGGLKVGLVLLAAAIAGAVLAALPGRSAWQRVCGWACVLVGVLYIVQMQRLLNATSSAPSLVDTIGVGAVIAVVGGLALALAPGASK